MKRSLDDILNSIISESRSEETPRDLREDKDFKELDQVWKLYDQVWATELPNEESAWQAIGEQIGEEKQKSRVIPLYVSRIAVAASFLLILGLALYHLQPQDPYITRQALVSDQNIVLPDSSSVQLRAGAQVRYLRDDLFTEDERIVFLDGEAIFDVSRDESRPFKVITSGTTVDVLGTSFSYLAEGDYSESENLSGLVKFFVNRDTSKKHVLNPGDKVSYDGQELLYTPIEVPEPPPIPRNNVRVDDLVDILGDRFPVSLTYVQGMNFNREVVAVDLRGSLTEILADLAQNEAVQIDYRRTAPGRYTLVQLRGIDRGLQADYTFQSYLIRRPYAQ